MSKQYQPWTQEQAFLLPPSLRDWLPEGHLAWFILDVVGQLDLSAIEVAIQAKDPRGQRPYHPGMMVALLIYAYCTGVYSSRRIERACQEDIAFRVISGNAQPFFTTINEFRRVHRERFAGLFVEVLRLCREAGLVKLHHVAVDGTKVKANASKHKAMSYRRMCQEEPRLAAEVERLLGEAEAADAREDGRHGAGVRGDELPAELARRESRLERIRAAKARLEAGARETRAAELRAQSEGMERTAQAHEDPKVQKGLRTNAGKRRAEAERLERREDKDEPPSGGGGTRSGNLVRKRTQATVEGRPVDGAQANFTDPESSIMVGGDGYIQAYNAQLAVDDAFQVVVAYGVTNQAPDAEHLVPMLERVRNNTGRAPTHTSADAGYWHAQVEDHARALGTEAWVATARTRHGEAGPPCANEDIPEGLTARARMRHRLDTPEGRALYARRKAIVEPVNGNIKHPRGFRQFSFRGLDANETEWALVSLCHNVLKLFGHRERPQTCPA